MKGVKNSLRVATDTAFLGALVFWLLIALSACKGGKPVTPASTSPMTIPSRTPAISSTPWVPVLERPDSPSTSYPPPQGASPGKTSSSIQVYPPPIDEGGLVIEVPEPSPTPTTTPVPFPETPPAPAGKAATLHNGDVWLVEPGHQPQALTDFGDVSVIFGWNHDGTKLLFERGQTTGPGKRGWVKLDLWLLESATRETRQLTSEILVGMASWSPVDDRIAYCGTGGLTVIDLAGEIQRQLDQVVCIFAWSPDGLAIALDYFTPEMRSGDETYTVLGVWWLADDRLQIFSDALDEVQADPVWSVDGKTILFLRICYKDKENETGFYVVDPSVGEYQRLEVLPSIVAKISLEKSRSPRADLVTFIAGTDIYVMDFQGRFEIVGQGRSPTWLPDDQTLLYRDLDGNLQMVVVQGMEVTFTETPVGGQGLIAHVYTQPEFFFVPGG